MKGWLLDTNVISELRKTNCHAHVKAWSEQQKPQSFFLSSVTVAEIRFGIELCADPSLREELTGWLDTVLRPWFTDRILGVDEDVILIWRQLVEKGRRLGHTFSQPDLFIAATAIKHELCIATRNTADFAKAEVAVFNPWRLSFTPV